MTATELLQELEANKPDHFDLEWTKAWAALKQADMEFVFDNIEVHLNDISKALWHMAIN